jgi:hypothetical protein
MMKRFLLLYSLILIPGAAVAFATLPVIAAWAMQGI